MTTKGKKILVIMDGVGPKSARGSDIIYSILERLVRTGINMHILTLIDYRTRKNWKEWIKDKESKFDIRFHYLNIPLLKRFHKLYFHFFKVSSFFIILYLYQRHNFNIIHEYSSNPILCYKTALLRVFVNRDVKLYQTLCTANTHSLKGIFIKGIKYLDKIVCHSQRTANLLIKKGCPFEKVVYLPIGVELDKFNKINSFGLDNEYPFPKDKKKILYIGPIAEQKGIYLLADVISEVIRDEPEVFFIFVCSKTFHDKKYKRNKRRLLAKISKYKEHALLVEGMVDTAAFFAISDIFIYPLKSAYGTLSIPLTLLEAMAAGKAIIASSAGGNREAIKDRKNGLLFSIENENQLPELIKELLKKEELRKKLGLAAQRTIKDSFDIKVNSRKLYNLYSAN